MHEYCKHSTHPNFPMEKKTNQTWSLQQNQVLLCLHRIFDKSTGTLFCFSKLFWICCCLLEQNNLEQKKSADIWFCLKKLLNVRNCSSPFFVFSIWWWQHWYQQLVFKAPLVFNIMMTGRIALQCFLCFQYAEDSNNNCCPPQKYGPLMYQYTWMNLCYAFYHMDDIEFLEWKSQCWWNQHVWMMKGTTHGWNYISMHGNEYHLLVGLLSCNLHKPPIFLTKIGLHVSPWFPYRLFTKFIEVFENILILNIKEL
jgi:hypothetical protein